MVDVGAKEPSERVARARARVRMSSAAALAVQRGDGPKGEVLGVARLAGMQAAKQTAQLIPLAHPLALTFVDVSARVDVQRGPRGAACGGAHACAHGRRDGGDDSVCGRRADGLRHGQGGRAGIVIEQVVLLEKRGGRSDYLRQGGRRRARARGGRGAGRGPGARGGAATAHRGASRSARRRLRARASMRAARGCASSPSASAARWSRTRSSPTTARASSSGCATGRGTGRVRSC